MTLNEKSGDLLIIIFRMQTLGFFSVRKSSQYNRKYMFAILQLYLTISNIILTICYFSGKFNIYFIFYLIFIYLLISKLVLNIFDNISDTLFLFVSIS